MSSRRGSETDQNPEASIETRVALAAICELVRVRGNSCPRALRWRRNAKDGGVLPVRLGRSGRWQPSQAYPLNARFWPVGGHGIPARIGDPSAAIAIPSLGIFDAPESIHRFPNSARLRKTKWRVEITFHGLCPLASPKP
jgi:hypothetical protein